MTPLQTAALGVRLFAIWLAVYCARWAPYLFGEARASREFDLTVVIVLAALLSIAAVLFLWFFPRSVARAILPAGDPPQMQTSSSPDAWLAIGCALVGLWVLSEAIPALVQAIWGYAYIQRGNLPVPDEWSARLVYALVEAAVGVWLVLGARGMRKVLRWARNR